VLQSISIKCAYKSGPALVALVNVRIVDIVNVNHLFRGVFIVDLEGRERIGNVAHVVKPALCIAVVSTPRPAHGTDGRNAERRLRDLVTGVEGRLGVVGVDEKGNTLNDFGQRRICKTDCW
jgi:hypothetical protein